MEKLKEMREAYDDLRKQAYDACIKLMKESGVTSVRFDLDKEGRSPEDDDYDSSYLDESDDVVWCTICYGDGQLADGRVVEVTLDEEVGQPHLSFYADDYYGGGGDRLEEGVGFYLDLYEALLAHFGLDS